MRTRRSLSAVAALAASVVLAASPATAQAVLETFESVPSSWAVNRDASGGGAITQVSSPVSSGGGAARLATSGAGATARLRATFSDSGASHQWNERPGTFRWQRLRVYVPSATVAQLSASGYLTLGGFWSSTTPTTGWYLRVRANGQLYVVGTPHDGTTTEFQAYDTVPTDRWFTLELGLHSQNGPGVKRAFAFFVDGVAHGWYRQGRLADETYDSVAAGVLDTSVASALEVFVDDWGTAGTASLPTGPDARQSSTLITKDFRTGNGADWQIDWSTWTKDLRLQAGVGLSSNSDRLQSGLNLDRAPALTSGWGEIEIDWTKGRPANLRPSSYFGPMIGMRKEINREQNLEVIPRGNGNGTVDLLLEAWDGNGPIILDQWPLPTASFSGSSIPEPGDIIRVRWEQLSPSSLGVAVSYYDASAGSWATNVIAGAYDISGISGINYNDGFHEMSSVTIDSPDYSIRRYHVGTLATYPAGGPACTYAVSPPSVTVPSTGGTGSIALTAGAGCAWNTTVSPWIALTSPASGSGSATIGYSVTANTTGATRTGSIAVGGQTVAFTQAAQPGSGVPAIAISDVTVTEGNSGVTPAAFAVTLSQPSTSTVTVAYATAGGSATAGTDFTPASGTLTFAPGETAKSIVVSVLADTLDELTETFSVVLSGPAGATIGDGVGAGTIFDDDPAPTIAVSDATVTEGTGGSNAAGFTVSLSAPSALVVQVTYATAAGTAAVDDFTATAGTLSFPPGTTTATVSVPIVTDAIVEPTESFTIVLSNPVNATIADGTGVGTIVDDDVVSGPLTATFAIAAGADDVNEEGTLADTGPSVFLGNGAGISYAGYRFTGVTIPQGAIITSARVSVLASSTQWNQLQFEWGAEASGNAAVFTAANRPSQRVLGSARVAHSTNAQWVAATWYALDDLAALLQPIVTRADWAPGNAVALIARGTGATWGRKFADAFETGAANAARLTVSYLPPGGGGSTPSISVNDVTVTEGTGGATTATFLVALSANPSQTVTVAYATADGTATAPADYTATSGTLTFPPGTTSLPVAVSVAPDSLVEPNETFALTLSAPANATIGDGTAIATIVNDDTAALPSIGVNDVAVTEGTGGTTTATFLVSLSASSSQTVSVGYATVNGTATAPADFTPVSGTLSFSPGVTSLSVSVPIVTDNVVEPNETFSLALSAPGNATIADNTGVATIINDDSAVAPAISVSDVTVTEGTGGSTTATFIVSLSASASQTITVAYATANGTATAPADFTGASGTLTFSPGVTSLSVPVTIVADAVVEANETFLLGLSNPTNATIADGTGVATIVNDDVAATSALSVTDVSVSEGTARTTTARFVVSLSPSSAQTVTVEYITTPGTATAQVDYFGISGTLTFAPGVTSQTVSVTLVSDAVVEPNETFSLVLQHATNATIADNAGVATIVDDDTGPAGPTTVAVRISGGGDDVNQDGTAFSATSSSVWVGNGTSPSASFTGLRFSAVPVPRGATITSAVLEVRSSGNQRVAVALEVGVESTANSGPFTTASAPGSRTLLTPRVSYASSEPWSPNTWYALGDVAALLQAIVSRPDWTPGNALTLVLHGTGAAQGLKNARSFEAGASTAPRLTITYAAP